MFFVRQILVTGSAKIIWSVKPNLSINPNRVQNVSNVCSHSVASEYQAL